MIVPSVYSGSSNYVYPLFLDHLTLKMKAPRSFEMLGTTNQNQTLEVTVTHFTGRMTSG